MSADDYVEVIRKVPGQPGRYFVTCEFASDDEWPDDEAAWAIRVERGKTWDPPREPVTYDTLAAAQEYAYSEYSEYGVTYSFPVETREREGT